MSDFKLPSDLTFEKYLPQWELYKDAHNGYAQYLSYEYDFCLKKIAKLSATLESAKHAIELFASVEAKYGLQLVSAPIAQEALKQLQESLKEID